MNAPAPGSDSTTARSRFARRHIAAYIITCIVIGLLTAAFFSKSWAMFWTAVAVGTVYAMFVTLFVLLAVVSGKPPESADSNRAE